VTLKEANTNLLPEDLKLLADSFEDIFETKK
jgi:hypothetical protein